MGKTESPAKRPWWVRSGLWGIRGRATAWAFFWLSVALTVVPGLVARSLGRPFFFCGIFLFAALWYWLCIRWVDRRGAWS